MLRFLIWHAEGFFILFGLVFCAGVGVYISEYLLVFIAVPAAVFVAYALLRYG